MAGAQEPTVFQKVEKVFAHVPEGLNIVIIGAGGNGGYLIPNLFRRIASMGVLRERIDVKVVDFDIVEEKNINRQMFIPADIGLNKAEVLVKRYGGVFGIPPQTVGFIPGKLSTPEQMMMLMSNLWTNVVIDCVDNTTARSIIYSGFVNHSARRFAGANYLISSGTGEITGQVGIGGYRINTAEKVDWGYYMPTPYAFHPEMVDPEHDKRDQALSCAERAARNVQSINTNLTAGKLMLDFMTPLLGALERIPYRQGRVGVDTRNYWTHGMVYFNTKEITFNSMPLYPEYRKTKNPTPLIGVTNMAGNVESVLNDMVDADWNVKEEEQ